jgi:hypothetical protein
MRSATHILEDCCLTLFANSLDQAEADCESIWEAFMVTTPVWERGVVLINAHARFGSVSTQSTDHVETPSDHACGECNQRIAQIIDE